MKIDVDLLKVFLTKSIKLCSHDMDYCEENGDEEQREIYGAEKNAYELVLEFVNQFKEDEKDEF